jgi:serine protease AprX
MKQEKLCPRLAVELELAGVEEEIPLLVLFRGEPEAVKALSAHLPVQHHFRLTPTATLSARPREIKKLSQDPRVVKVWRDRPVHACLDTSVPLIRAPQVWETGFTGRGIRIAVLDTGIDREHPDLASRVALTQDFTGEGFADHNGHGTHVAGIIAGQGSRYRGVAPEASLIGVKVMGAGGSGMMSGTMKGVEWAVEHGAQVINLSLGSPGACDGTDPLSRTCDAAVERGVVVCVAGGNLGPLSGSIGSPGCARQVITVGASTDRDRVADFSSRGPTLDGRVKPDILCPGHNIISARAQGTHMGNPIDELYTEASGTSMACPHASGAAALLLQAKPGLSPAQVKELLMKGARDLGLAPNTQGAGRADVYAALRGEAAPAPPEITPVPTPAPGAPVARGCLPPVFWRFRSG